MAAKFKLKVTNLTFKHVRLVFTGGALVVSRISRWKREESSALDLADSHVSVGEESVELFHKVLADKV